MLLSVLDGSALKTVGGEEHTFVGAGRPLLVCENLDILALHRSCVIFALNKDQEFDANRREANRDVDPIPAVVRKDQLLLFEPEVV